MIPFSGPTPTPVVRLRGNRLRTWLRRRREPSDPRGWNLTLASVGLTVSAWTVVDSPLLLTAVVEDFQWRLAMANLRTRRPRWWRRSEKAAWKAELHRLDETRRRIAEMAMEGVNAL